MMFGIYLGEKKTFMKVELDSLDKNTSTFYLDLISWKLTLYKTPDWNTIEIIQSVQAQCYSTFLFLFSC